jgi:hypothetical protein
MRLAGLSLASVSGLAGGFGAVVFLTQLLECSAWKTGAMSTKYAVRTLSLIDL